MVSSPGQKQLCNVTYTLDAGCVSRENDSGSINTFVYYVVVGYWWSFNLLD